MPDNNTTGDGTREWPIFMETGYIRRFTDADLPNHVRDALALIERWTNERTHGHWEMGGIQRRVSVGDRQPVHPRYRPIGHDFAAGQMPFTSPSNQEHHFEIPIDGKGNAV
jgi:hypothetical protein